MKILAVVTSPSIYIKLFCNRNVSKHREIKNGEQNITLDISLKFGNLDKMKIKSSEPKYY